jgi:hypothetical protein
MKVWREFGSSHSGNVTVIGEFDSVSEAQGAFPLLEDFVQAAWEERYEDVDDFKRAWQEKEQNATYYLTQQDYDIGVDNSPEITWDGAAVVIGRLRSENINGIVKILFAKGMKKITVTGKGA